MGKQTFLNKDSCIQRVVRDREGSKGQYVCGAAAKLEDEGGEWGEWDGNNGLG